MALAPAIMYPEFISAFATPTPDPAILGVRVVNNITNYLSTGNNAAFGSFVCWGFPYSQMIEVFATPNLLPEIFALKFSMAVWQGLMGLYTVFQVNATSPGLVMLPSVVAAARKFNLNSVPFSIELANAIHLQATSTVITVADPKTLFIPYPGPFI